MDSNYELSQQFCFLVSNFIDLTSRLVDGLASNSLANLDKNNLARFLLG